MMDTTSNTVFVHRRNEPNGHCAMRGYNLGYILGVIEGLSHAAPCDAHGLYFGMVRDFELAGVLTFANVFSIIGRAAETYAGSSTESEDVDHEATIEFLEKTGELDYAAVFKNARVFAQELLTAGYRDYSQADEAVTLKYNQLRQASA